MERKKIIDEISKLSRMAEWIYVPMIGEIEEKLKGMSIDNDKEAIGKLLPELLYYKHDLSNIDNKIQELRESVFAFSVEEIYLLFGRFDNFVSIDFHRNSEARKDYGESIMGVFIYNRREREDLNKIILSQNMPRTNEMVRFNASNISNLTYEQKETLSKIGFLSGDIRAIDYFVGDEKDDKYLVTDKKEIPNTILIEFDPNEFEWELIALKLLSDRMVNNDPPLIDFEIDKYYAYKILHSEDEISDEEWKNNIFEINSNTIKERIMFHILSSKMQRLIPLTPDDIKSLIDIFPRRRNEINKIVENEIKKSAKKNLKEIISSNQTLVDDIKKEAFFYEPENLSTHGARYSVFLDLERYLHIFLRHLDELQLEDWQTEKTAFQYNLKDVKRLLRIIIKELQPQIDMALEQGKEINLYDKKAFYFNGNYYVIHISSTGRLLSFYPHKNL